MKKISIERKTPERKPPVENPVFQQDINRLFNNGPRKAEGGGPTDKEGTKMGYSNLTFCCPYYETNGARSVRCEGGRIALPNQGLTQAYFEAYCGDVNGWRRCTVARAITRFYERVNDD